MKDLIRRILREQREFENYEDLKNYLIQQRKKDNLYNDGSGVFNMKDFQEKEGKHYEYALKNNWLPKLAIELSFDETADENQRKIYVYTWEEERGHPKTAYVGLTCDVVRRNKKHTKCDITKERERRTAVGNEIIKREKYNYEKDPKFVVLTTNFVDEEEAALIEKKMYYLYRGLGYHMLNDEKKLGVLGNKRLDLSQYSDSQIWNKIRKERAYSPEDIKILDPLVYEYIKKTNPKKYGLNIKKERDYHSDEDLKGFTQNTDIFTFKNNNPKLFRKIINRNKLDDFYKGRLKFNINKGEDIINYKEFKDVISYVKNDAYNESIKDYSIINNLIDYGTFKYRDKDKNIVTITQTEEVPNEYKRRVSRRIYENAIKKVLKEESSKLNLLKLIQNEDIFSAAELVGGIDNLKKIFKEFPDITDMIDSLKGELDLTYHSRKEYIEFPMRFEIVGKGENVFKNNSWPIVNLIYDDSMFTDSEKEIFDSFVFDSINDLNIGNVDMKPEARKMFREKGGYIGIKYVNGKHYKTLENEVPYEDKDISQLNGKYKLYNALNESNIIKENEDNPTQKILNFLLRRYKIDEVDLGWTDNPIKLKMIKFDIDGERYSISTFENKRQQIAKILDMLTIHNVIDNIDSNEGKLDPYTQKVVRAVKQFINQVM